MTCSLYAVLFGWPYATAKGDDSSLSPYLIPWELLPTAIGGYDRGAVRAFPEIFASGRYELLPPPAISNADGLRLLPPSSRDRPWPCEGHRGNPSRVRSLDLPGADQESLRDGDRHRSVAVGGRSAMPSASGWRGRTPHSTRLSCRPIDDRGTFEAMRSPERWERQAPVSLDPPWDLVTEL